MVRLQQVVFWLGLGYAAVVYGVLGILFLLTPDTLSSSGIAFVTDHGASAVRVGFGAPFLSLALVAVYGIVQRDRAFICLTIVTFFSAMIALSRIFAITIDGGTEHNLIELRDEGVSALFFVFALWCGRQRRRA